MLNKDDISFYPPEELLINDAILQNSIKQKPYKEFIPTITLHFEKSCDEIDLHELKQLLGPNITIIQPKKGSTILNAAILEMDILGPDAQKKYESYISDLKKKLTSERNRTIVGNFKEEPVVTRTTFHKWWFSKPSINRLQNEVPLSDSELAEYKEQIFKNLKDDGTKENLEFLFKHSDLYDEMERQLRIDLEENPYEMIIVEYSIIADKFFEEFYFQKSCFYRFFNLLANSLRKTK